MYVAHTGRHIVCISDTPGPNLIKIPEELQEIDPAYLLDNYMVKDGKMVPKVRPPKRIAVIAPYNINCGIATYTSYIIKEWHLLGLEYRVFANETTPIGTDPDFVMRNWTPDNFDKLVPAIREYDPDIVYIQHEFGYFFKLKKWQNFLSRISKDYRVITAMHTVLEHRMNHPEASLDYRMRYLAEMACPELIVHTPKAVECLRDRGYSGLIHVIPHGCHKPNRMSYIDPGRYNMHSRNLIFQYGFGGKYKGWKSAIEAVKIASQEVPDIFYLGIYNIPHRHPEAVLREFEELIDYVDVMKMNGHVAIIKGYQKDEMLKNTIRSAKAGLFLYSAPPNWASWGASGAIQLPVSMGLPMVLGDYPAFDEFKESLSVVKSPEDAAKELVKICKDPAYQQSLIEKSLKVADSRSWDKVAKWYLEVPSDKDSSVP